MLLRVSDMACARGGVPVLEGLSFDLDAGQALVLRGPNGIGKTTLLRTLAGLQPVLRGTVEVRDGAKVLHECLILCAALDGVEVTYEYKRLQRADGKQPLDFVQAEDAPVAFLTR